MRSNPPRNLVEVVATLRRQSEVTGDELNLINSLIYSALVVTKHHNAAQVGTLAESLVTRPH